MIELRDKAQREQYIRELWSKLFGEKPGKINIEFIDVGALNYVYRVQSNGSVIYFKQALHEAKHKNKIGEDFVSIPKERIRYERRFIEIVAPLVPPQIEIPRILEYDSHNNILVLSDVKKDGILLEDSLLYGNFNEGTAYYLGKFLGITHKATFGQKRVVRGSKKEDIDIWELYLRMRTIGILKNGKLPLEVNREVKRFYEDVRNHHIYNVLANSDCCPKNAFERKNGIGLVDFEMATGIGDPPFDLGFLLGHYFLMIVIRNDRLQEGINAARQITRGYDEEMLALKDNDNEKRAVKYAGMTMIYRIAGSSPAPYIDRSDASLISRIRKVAFQLITRNFSKFDNSLDYLQLALKSKNRRT